jgi:pyruvate,water dikinase
MGDVTHVKALKELGMSDVSIVGGKNASLGEMIQALSGLGVKVPGGFATTSESFWAFLAQNNTSDKIYQKIDQLDIEDVHELARVGRDIREMILALPLLPEMEKAVRESYALLGEKASVAVRSSATAEDLPDASFAGQQETFLNVVGIENVLTKVKEVYASLFNDRAISYREHQGFSHREVAISVGVQQMVRSDLAASGVMFSIDTESGFDQVVFITSSYGLGEMVVQGAVNPDEFYVHKPTLKDGRPAIIKRTVGSKEKKMIYSSKANSEESVEVVPVLEREQRVFSLSNEDIETLAHYALIIEAHYKRPMDIEWGKDGKTGELYILQARPETVNSQNTSQIIER